MGGGHVSRPDFGMPQPDPACPLTEFYLLLQHALDAAGICKMQPWLRQTVSAPYALFERVKLLIAAQAGVLEDAQYGADILVTYRIPAGADEALRTALREASSGTIAPQLLEEIFCAG